MHDNPARLLLVAHGTRSANGLATAQALVHEVAAQRAGTAVDLCFLDVATPTLTEKLDERVTVAVPLLLSTGFHVQQDIPDAVRPFPRTTVARHLGPHPLLVDALVERMGPTDGHGSVALVGAGSSRPEARRELDATAALLSERLGLPTTVLTMADDLTPALARLDRPAVATYLLAEGQFVTTLRAAAPAAVVEPLGVHPALVELVWARYDEAHEQVR